MFPEAAVTIESQVASHAGRYFCGRCGSSLYSRVGDEVEVHLGALDAPDALRPTYEIWTLRREAWLPAFRCPPTIPATARAPRATNPEPDVGSSRRYPRRAASIAAMSILVIVIMASNARRAA